MSSSILNPLDDATHEVLDQQVNKLVGNVVEEPRDKDYLFLLQTIVNCSNGALDPPEGIAIFEIWRYFKHLDRLPSKVLVVPAVCMFAHQSQPGRKAFTAPYRGKAVDAFCQYLEQRNKKFDPYGPGRAPKYYDKFCSIIQSSGTGKSRLLLEVHPFIILSMQRLVYPIQLSKKGVVVLYMNLRPTDDYSGFPVRDDVPAVILTGNPETTAADYGARCCAFFAAVFTTVREYLSTRLASGSLEDSLKQWNDSMCNLGSEDRRQFFVTLKAKYETYYKLIKSDMFRDAVVKIGGKAGNLSLQGEQVEQAMEQASQPIEQREEAIKSPPGHKYMTSAYLKMTRSLGQLFDSGNRHKPKLVIALDEAHSLGVLRPYGYCPSTILCRAINIYSEADRTTNHAVWVVFVSTDLKVADFAAARPYLFAEAPYSQLGWDQRADPLEGTAAADVARIGHIVGFGRPLWKSLQELYNVQEMMLVGSSKIAGPPGNKNLPLVTLSQRFCLNVTSSHREDLEFIASSVASHLHVCITATKDHDWSSTTYPSEPFLSCVAASLLHRMATWTHF
ncbi:hypothetical protein EDC04DRAFT_2890753 [Pisolithus marmoratus]|nr:hypothetical protein EDC04DRAFT_2890753 [Pisolithus marmoratus]